MTETRAHSLPYLPPNSFYPRQLLLGKPTRLDIYRAVSWSTTLT